MNPVQAGAETVLSRRRFDVDEYHQMARAGILHEDDHVQLLDGEIVEMPAVGSRHVSCVGCLNQVFVRAVGNRGFVTIQSPVRLNRYSEPEPDVAVLRPRADNYAGALPGSEDALLIAEVTDSSLRLDRSVKLPLYAAAGIREVWIVDLTEDAVLVHRAPEAGAYRTCNRVVDGAVTPLAFPDLRIRLRDFVPSRV